MSDARKALQDWQVNNLHSGPFAMPQYDDFARIVEGIERDAARIAELESEVDRMRDLVFVGYCEGWLKAGGEAMADNGWATSGTFVALNARAELKGTPDE